MKAMKVVGIVLAVIVALFVGVGLTLPKDLKVEESTTIQAPIGNVWRQLSTLQAHASWSPWKKQDPSLEPTYSGPEQGVGQTSEWNTETMGRGKQVVTEYIENELIATDLDFYEHGRGKAVLRVETGETDVKVVWSYYSEAENLIARYFQKFMGEPMLHAAYADGLADLKAQAEAMPVEEPAAAVDNTAAVEGTAATEVSTSAQ